MRIWSRFFPVDIEELNGEVKEVANKGAIKQNILELQGPEETKEASEMRGVKWDHAWQTFQEYVKQGIQWQGGSSIYPERINCTVDESPHLKEFVENIQEKTEDGQKLTEVTYSANKNVLETRWDKTKILLQKK